MDKRRKRRPFSIDQALTPADREAYIAYLSDGRTTIAMAHQ